MKKVTDGRVLYGRYFGYPPCCIKDFVNRPDASTITEDQSFVHHNHGFIPCDKHAKMILDGRTTLWKLIRKTRACPWDFPLPGSLGNKSVEVFEKLQKKQQKKKERKTSKSN